MNRTIGQALRDFRRAKGLQAKEIADAINISKQAWSNYESGYRTPRVDTIDMVASKFKLSTDYLVGRTKYDYDPTEAEFRELMSLYVKMDSSQKKKLIKFAQKLNQS